MERSCGPYLLSDDLAKVDFEVVHEWLTHSYWSAGIAREKVDRAARNSAMVIGAYLDSEQAGYVRIISDKATFAWVCDVFVAEAHRKKGLAKAMMRFAMEHPDYQGLRRWLLATKDAHDVYGAVGFEALPYAERFMIWHP